MKFENYVIILATCAAIAGSIGGICFNKGMNKGLEVGIEVGKIQGMNDIVSTFRN